MKKENTTEEKITINNKKPVVKEAPSEQESKKDKGLTKEDLPDASNESAGKTGSGQRQDSN